MALTPEQIFRAKILLHASLSQQVLGGPELIVQTLIDWLFLPRATQVANVKASIGSLRASYVTAHDAVDAEATTTKARLAATIVELDTLDTELGNP